MAGKRNPYASFRSIRAKFVISVRRGGAAKCSGNQKQKKKSHASADYLTSVWGQPKHTHTHTQIYLHKHRIVPSDKDGKDVEDGE